jgi:hypothetical protein
VILDSPGRPEFAKPAILLFLLLKPAAVADFANPFKLLYWEMQKMSRSLEVGQRPVDNSNKKQIAALYHVSLTINLLLNSP